MMPEIETSEAPAEGQQIITTCAFIHKKIHGIEHVFMAKRSADKGFLPNVFELPGGHVEFGELPVESLQREIIEELGTAINIGDPFAAFTYQNDLKGSHSIEVIYFATFTDEEVELLLNPDDHSEFGWFSEETLKDATTPDKGLEDDEFVAIRSGFRILAGSYDSIGVEVELPLSGYSPR